MKILSIAKDGGPKSRVYGFFVVEWKRFFSVCFLWFKDGSREAYHSHAFNAISWVIWGRLTEDRIHSRPYVGEMCSNWEERTVFRPSLKPIVTTRDNFHKVRSAGNTFVLSFRGPWADTWKERNEAGEIITLTHGRKEV